MAGEKKTEKPEPVATRMKSGSFTEFAEEDAASRKDGILSDSTSSISSAGNNTLRAKGETAQESVADQDVYYPPTSCYDYYYPGYNGPFTQFDDRGYCNVGDGTYTGIHSDDGSLLYYLPGYDPYASGTFMGAGGQQPYISSSGYLQHPASYGPEAIQCYSWDSMYVGDVNKGTTTIPGNVKSTLGSNEPLKSNGFNSMKTNNNFGTKISTLPLDSKSRQFTNSSNFTKSSFQSQPLKPSNKFGPGFQSASFIKGFNPVGKHTSYSNQKQGVLAHNGPMYCRLNGRVPSGISSYKLSEKSDRNEASTELTCGPRAHNRSSTLNLSAGGEELGITVQRDKYNLEDFKTKHDNAKFYVIKSYSEDDIHKCIKYDVWSSTPNGNKKLDAAFLDAEAKSSETGRKCPVFLFFSVNGSGQFVGLAEMIGPVDFNKNMDFWQLDKWNGFFPVKWHIVKDIPNMQLRHIVLENNHYKAVTYSRDTQEIALKQGSEMLNIFNSYSAKTSLLDDFSFYENREKLLKTKRSSKPASQTDAYKNKAFPQKNLKPEEKFLDEESATNSSSDSTSSVINLTQNLSLNSHPLKNSPIVSSSKNSVPSVAAAAEAF